MIPQSLADNPRLDRWVQFRPNKKVLIAFGKVEYGQGAATTLAQIGAEELDVDMARVEIAEPSTQAGTPNEGLTVGSMSIESSGASVRVACAEVRALFLAHAADKLSCGVDELSVRDGAVLREGQPTGEDYWSLLPGVDLKRDAKGEVKAKAPKEYRVVGTSTPRYDLPAKVFGAAFMHDFMPEGVVHARVLRQPGSKARLAFLDEAAARKAAGDADLEIFREQDFVAFLSSRESAANAAVIAAEQRARWEDADVMASNASDPEFLRGRTALDFENGAPPNEESNRRRFKATYSRPYIFHGSMGPACAVAELKNDRLSVWTHAQGVYPIRVTISKGTGFPVEQIDVHHMQGPGNYGHNGSDDAAFDAAFLALKHPGKPIRVQWRREDEFGYAPCGTAMAIDVSAELDASGKIADYSCEIWTGPHPNRGRALAESALPGYDHARSKAPAFPFGGQLNAIPSYEIATTRVKEHLVIDMPVRTSSLRGLGGPPNEFASECFIDELAEAAGRDPLEYRLSMLSNPRQRQVLEAVARMCGWDKRGPGGTGVGLGLCITHHRNRGAIVSAAALVEVDEEVRLKHLWCAADCGLIINPDGARNQIEGGMIMAASWALKEEVRLEGHGIAFTTWDEYPILRFDEVPPVTIELINRLEEAPLGIGEVSSGPTLAAIGNAVSHALGARIRDLPMTRERIAHALLKQDA